MATRQQGLPPAMPCINLGHGGYQGLDDGKLRHFPRPEGYRVGASFGGGWLFCYHERSGQCFLRRPFSGEAILISALYHMSPPVDAPMEVLPNTVLMGGERDIKMVVCSSRLVVAMIRCPRSGFFDRVFCFASFQQQLMA
jgi:hypothetical protein